MEMIELAKLVIYPLPL